ncbi:hypothetical protein [Mycobacterium sp. IS-1496]|uniref:hypothetical protein n=1 Tax=Mycobacterium sp. IS-1496 TaxID=1772284 RepID=UPI0012F93501|nr:hypothetical protein [Mycobacterium sp. IS-1496]
MRYLWTAEAGIDVLTGPAVPIRAFIESLMLSQYAGDMSYAYPGFERAVPDGGSDLWVTRPALDVPSDEPSVGNITHHILSVSHAEDDVSAVICIYNYRLAVRTDDGSYRSVARTGSQGTRGIHATKVGLTGPSPSMPPQTGPRPDPVDDVFGEWHIRGLLDSFSRSKQGFDETWPTYEADLKTCVDRAPDPASVRAEIIDGTHPRDFFPTSPASPGWPEAAGN